MRTQAHQHFWIITHSNYGNVVFTLGLVASDCTTCVRRLLVDGKKYSGGVDGGLTPHGIMPSSAGSMWCIGFEHKQSTLDKDAYHARNNLHRCDERRLNQGLNAVVQVASHSFWGGGGGGSGKRIHLWRGLSPGCLLSHSCLCHVSIPTGLRSVRWKAASFAKIKGRTPVGVARLYLKTGTKWS